MLGPASTRWLRGLQQILRQIVQLLMMLWWSRAPSSAEPAQAAAWLQEELSASNDVIERGKRSRQQVELFQPDGDGLRNFAMGHGGCFGRGDRPLGACRGAAGLKLEAPEQQRRFHQVTVTVTG